MFIINYPTHLILELVVFDRLFEIFCHWCNSFLAIYMYFFLIIFSNIVDIVSKQLLRFIQNGPETTSIQVPPHLPPEVKDAGLYTRLVILSLDFSVCTSSFMTFL